MCITTVSLFTTLRFFNGTASCQHGKDRAYFSRKWPWIRPFDHDSSVLRQDRLTSARYFSKGKGTGASKLHFFRWCRLLSAKQGLFRRKWPRVPSFLSTTFRFLNGTVSCQYGNDTIHHTLAGKGHGYARLSTIFRFLSCTATTHQEMGMGYSVRAF